MPPVSTFQSTLLAEGAFFCQRIHLQSRFGNSREPQSPETDQNYLSHKAGDVWDFIDRIAKWVDDTNRKGCSNMQQGEELADARLAGTPQHPTQPFRGQLIVAPLKYA